MGICTGIYPKQNIRGVGIQQATDTECWYGYAYISKVKYIRCRYTASDGYKAKYIKIHRTQTMDIAIYLDNISKYYMQVTV